MLNLLLSGTYNLERLNILAYDAHVESGRTPLNTKALAGVSIMAGASGTYHFVAL
jgi:hypothetical protein